MIDTLWVMVWYWGGWLQNRISTIRLRIVWFHDYCIGYIWSVLVSVYVICIHVLYKTSPIDYIDGEVQVIEFIWTLIPVFILLRVGLHSLDVLYSMRNKSIGVKFKVKVRGHQWYWSYEYSDIISNITFSFDSYIKPLPRLELGEYRLLDVDNRTIVPIGIDIELVVKSSDVLHSLCIPAITIKIDANPARINARVHRFVIPGQYYGQCSELCGVNHSFMPICIEATSYRLWSTWLNIWSSLIVELDVALD